MMSNSAFLPENDSTLSGLLPPANGAFQPELRGSEGNRALWETASRLTLSFAPDGTKISRYDSSLYSSFGHMLNAQQLQETILNAFQSWAQYSSVNVGLVPDSGDDFGIGGATQNDPRFGDIRVGAVPMAGDVFAVAVPHNNLMSGTWAGDILFNSNANFTDVDQFFAVALHEVGHVLGLEHSEDITSVMHPTALNQSLNSADIQEVQSFYGNRILDQYDLDSDTNDTMETAVRIRNNGSINGIIPLVVFGDISGQADVDYFYIRPNSGYQGSISFRLISESVSVMRGKLTVVDEGGNIIGSVTESSNEGTDISVQVNNVDDSLEYFVKVESTGSTANRFGSFGLVATIDGQLSQGYDLIETAIRRNYGFLSQGDVQDLFLSDLNAPIQDDLHTNDTASTATELEQSPNAAAQNDYRIQASISDSIDVDFYVFEALDSMMSIRVNAMESRGLISKINVLDASLQPISGVVKVNGNGELLIDFQGIIPGDAYYVSVVADRPGRAFDVGNYDMNLSFGNSSGSLETLGAGHLSKRRTTASHSLYVARTQLFHFSLTGLNPPAAQNATLWMTIYDEEGDIKYRVATRLDETRTSQSVILRPGSYSMRVHISAPNRADRRNSIFSIPDIDYRVDGVGISDPTGPELIDPLEDPFSPCDKSNGQFCYPNDLYSFDPFIVVEGGDVTLPKTVHNPNWLDANAWYWRTGWPG